MTDPDALLTDRLFARAWEHWARRSPAGRIADLPGLAVRWMNVAWPICNLTFLAEPVRDAGDLAARAATALDDARDRGRGWLLFLCEDLLPDGVRESFRETFAGLGMAARGAVTGMVAERLLPPRRPLPDLDLRPVADAATRHDFAAVNALAYKIPVDLGVEALAVETLWGAPGFGVVGYRGGEPVTTAKAIALDGALYMALVATVPAHQKQGFAEAAMRRALDLAGQATGLERTVLHASGAGLPLYQEMGYRPVAKFVGFMP